MNQLKETATRLRLEAVQLIRIAERLEVERFDSEGLLAPENTIADRIAQLVCFETKVELFRLLGASRKRSIATARKILYRALTATDMSLSEIGEFLGGRDHSTVTSGCRALQDEMDVTPTLRAEVERIDALVKKLIA
jgi:chromosomal replication initiation ATPase DnaA